MQSLPKIVRARLRPATPATAESHPDADLLTAFAEQSLAGRERDHVVEHLSRCRDCREVVLLALPAEVELQPLAASAMQTSANWFRWRVLRWVALAAGVAVVASIGTVQYRRQQGRELASNVIQEKQAIPAPLQSPQPSSQAPVPEAGIQNDTAGKPANSEGAISHRRATSADGISGGVAGGISGGVAPVPSATQIATEPDTEPAQAPADRKEAGQEAVGKAKPALAQAFPAAPAPSMHSDSSLKKSPLGSRWTISASGALQRSLDGGQTWLDVDVAADQSMGANLPHRAKTQMPAAGNAEAQTALTSQAQSDTQTELAAEPASGPASGQKTEAKSAARFAAPANAKSMDKQFAPAAPTIFRAVSVSSNAEVWPGGSGGALYHTIDGGNRWVRVVPSAAGNALTGDIISIQFSDAQSGTVTTSSAEVWTTGNDGQSWQRQQ